MNITDVTKLAGAHRRRKRVGRGEGSGWVKTSGRGGKGATARAGYKSARFKEGGQMPSFRRWPKRGFSNAKFRVRYSIVNVADLESAFESGDHVTAQSLSECGLLRHVNQPVKVLGNGELSKKLVIEAARFSKSAEQKIRAAGGEPRVTAISA